MAQKKLTASDIGLYAFCPRAWTLKQLGYKSGNLNRMEAGTAYHEAFGQQVRRNRAARVIIEVLLMIILCAAAALLLWRWDG